MITKDEIISMAREAGAHEDFAFKGEYFDMSTTALERFAALVAAKAREEERQASKYSWATVQEYENDVGFQVNSAFQMGWDMARTTDSFLAQLGRAANEK